jgi:vacuolar-type H+-ATPase subunit C/Vma6
LNIKEYTINDIELALYHNYIKMIGKIMLYSPPNMRSFLRNYLLKFEIINIKHTIIGSILGLNLKEKKRKTNFLVEEYLENTEFMEDLLKISSLDAIQFFMKKTKYNIPVREGIFYFKNYGEIFVLESFLDQFYYENLLTQLKNLNAKEKKIITLFIKYKTEIYNINIIYRGLKNNIEKNLLSQFLVNSYLFLDKGKIEYLLSLEDVSVFITLLEDYITNVKEIKQYYKNIVINPNHLIHSIEKLYLNYYFKKFKVQIDDIDSITIFRILEILIKKEEEIRFNIIPMVVNILHANYRKLKT